MGSVPLGIHSAVCIGVIDMGTQKSFYRDQKKVALLWEIHVNNQVKNYSREYTLSYHKNSALRLHLESWRGRPFTKDELSKFKLRNILGVPCKLEISKNAKGLKQVENVYRFPQKEEAPLSQTEYIYFDISDENTYSALTNIPAYIVTKIKQSPEYKQSPLNKFNE